MGLEIRQQETNLHIWATKYFQQSLHISMRDTQFRSHYLPANQGANLADTFS